MIHHRRTLVTIGAIVVVLAMLLSLVALAIPAAALPDRPQPFPELIPLPEGFQPEGIVVAPGGTAYAGSLADGSIVAADLRTGELTTVFDDETGTPAVGIEHDPSSRLLYVAGGASGTLEAVNPRTGTAQVAELTTPSAGFINDVAIHGDTLYATESFGSTLFAVELEGDGFGQIREITLGGDFSAVPGDFNANGIVALPDGRLIIVQSATGMLFTVDPDTGEATAVELDAGTTTLANGDGIERQGRTLYVVQNFLNQIAVVDLGGDATTGTVERVVKDPAFRIPTTVDRFGSRLYVVNARFGVADPGVAEYEIVGTELH